MNWQSRFIEWKALLDYACEHREELEANGKMVSIVWTLQRHWQGINSLRQEMPDVG